MNSWLELRETEVYHHLGSWREVTEHQIQLGNEKKRQNRGSEHRGTAKGSVFQSLCEVRAWQGLRCSSELSPGGEANRNPKDSGGERDGEKKNERTGESLARHHRENGDFNPNHLP